MKTYDLKELLDRNKISQKTYTKVSIAKNYIERKYNLKTFTNVNTACNTGKLNSPSNEVSTKKKKLKVIQNFSKYKKRSVINEFDNKNYLNKNVINNYNISNLGKNKPVFSNKVNKINGDEDNVNFNLDDF